MTKSLLAIALAATATATVQADLVLHWPLDENSGTTAADTSPNALDGLWQGNSGAPGWRPAGGIDGGCADFTGSDADSFITSSFNALTDTPFTISAWVKSTSSQNDGLVYLGNGNSGNQYYVVRMQGRLGRANVRNTSEVQCAGTTNISDNSWHHVVAVYADEDDRRIYIDGELERTSTSSVDPLPLTRFGIGALARNTPYNPADLYTGQLDDVALWDRPLTPTDIAALQGLVAHGAGNAADLEPFVAAFAARSQASVRDRSWEYTTGLAGDIGTISGNLANDNAAIVMDNSGNGMRIAGPSEPAVLSFTADYNAISQGVPATLTWSLANTDTATISGLGPVDPDGGTRVVNPASTTTYTLTATNPEGTSTSTLTIDVATTSPTPTISEFLARNDSGLLDEDGEHSDWIEIHNPGSFAIDLAGYSLTTDPTLLARWQVPPTILDADQYLVVFASAKDRTTSPYHTGFTLDADGDYLALVAPDGTTIVQQFSPAFPPQTPDLSYSTAGFHSPPTPGETNGAGAITGILKNKVDFTTPGGLFFGGTVNLTLSHPDPDVTIRYTLDGALPDSGSPAYTSPVPITSTTLVKTAAFRTGYIPGPLSQESFIFAHPSLSSRDSDLPLLVIDTFNTPVPRNDRAFKTAVFAAFDPREETGRAALSDPLTTGGQAGIHVRGESSQLNGFNKLNFAFETRNTEGEDKATPLFGMPAGADWALHASEIDRTFIRERLPHHLSREIGRYSPRTRPVEVYLNQDGGPVSSADYRGVYIVVERIRRGNDRVDIAKLDPDENTGPDVTGGYIFKDDKSDPGDVNVSTPGAGNFAIIHPDGNSITTAQRNYLQTYLRDFESALDSASFRDPETGYANYIDVESWIDMHVIQEFTKEVDSYVFSTFFHKDKDGKIVNGPLWDFDRSFGNVQNGGGIQNPEGWNGGTIGGRGAFWDRLFEDPDFMQRYIDRWQELMQSTLSEDHLFDIIDTMAAEVNEAQARNFEPAGPWPLANVTRSHLTFPTYGQHVTYLKIWVRDRLDWVQTQFTRPPSFATAPGNHTPFSLNITSPSGTIYYTTDGTDPRAPGGSISGTAYTGSIPVSNTTTITARARVGSDWSGPVRGTYIIGQPASAANFAISEIMYHPSELTDDEITAGFTDAEQFEYIEFLNTGSTPIELADVQLADGITFQFPATTLAPGARILLVRDQTAFEARYGAGLPVAGEYGGKLNNDGERILVTAADGSTIQDFTYNDAQPWPASPDGDGTSLVFVSGDPDQPLSWRPASTPNPGTSDTVPYTPGTDLLAYALASLPHIDGGTLTFTLTPGADDAVTELQFSPDLVSWTTSDLPLADRSGQTLSYGLPQTPGFYRLQVSPRD